MIMVAHRLSTIQHANKIFVFDKGRIIESGSHQELLKKRGRYYQLYKLQYQQNPFFE
jgi:ATP-binding cassette subfamily B protein